MILVLLLGLAANQSVEAQIQAIAEQFTQESSSSSASSASSRASEQASSSGQSESVGVDVNEVINVSAVTESWQSVVEKFLASFGFTSSWSAHALASAVVGVIAFVIIILIRVGNRKLYGKLRQRTRLPGNIKRIKLYHRLSNFSLILLTVLFACLALVVVWWGDSSNTKIVEGITGWSTRLLSFTIGLIVTMVVFEVVVTAAERYFYRLSSRGSARINTLLPIVRNILYGTLVVIFGITLISELGVDVTPLLASAGVVGIAVGFGAQALIKDVLNGFILIFEDLIQVGDVAGVGGKTGIVEKITLRKVQLRDLDGRVYTVPCGEIKVVENYTKEFSYYMFNVGVAYRESPDEVIEVLKEIGAEMQEEDEYKDLIIEPIEILGVDQFADSAIVIKARIMTKPIKQWQVGREFNRRMKYAFDERNIEIPFPHQTLYFGEDKDGSAPAARIAVQEMPDAQASAANDGEASEQK
ncbi:mechanosensitive ion channel family protein [Gilvimarinus xylanilyticus]|uniref:Mechanosensitive ion channel family protein n=1 Tax=Gilvimarinus xylanilyticus TaxID=2944139 RepID=A0A9X2HXU9_9GAMM|nr:mechanosensitive ion channel family protein [Gilvimarinus xylanilyticus]MCP8900085.1 mechanosensitive ion channel family protein [Gilvimarinus xylanilyticus]